MLAVGSYDFRRLLQWLSFMLRLFLAALRSAPDDQNCLPVPKGGPDNIGWKPTLSFPHR